MDSSSQTFETQVALPEMGPTDRMILDRFRKTIRLIRTEECLKKACSSVVILNGKIRELTNRFVKDRLSIRYSVRLRLAVAEGVRDMFYEYARFQAHEIADLRKELYNQSVEIVSGLIYDDDDSYDSSDDDVDDVGDFGR